MATLASALGDAAETIEEAIKPRLRGVLHEAAFAISLITGTVIVTLAEGPRERVAAAVYAGSVALLFGTSAAYHRGTWSTRSHALMARLDHSMIFVLIAGTYTPFCLLLLDGWLRWTMLSVIWAVAVAGILLRNVLRQPSRWAFVAIYLAMGWAGLLVMPQVLDRGGVAVLILMGCGGLFYTAGAVVYARRKPDPSPRWFGFHEVFHACTLAAFAVHYIAVSLAVYGS